MRSLDIWISVLFIAVIPPKFIYANPSTDEFIVANVYNMTITAAPNQIAFASAGNGKICYAYRSKDNAARVIFGHGIPGSIINETSAIDYYSLFDVLVMPSSDTCILFYTKTLPTSCYIYYKIENLPDVGPDNCDLLWDNIPSTMNVIVYPGSSKYLVGFSSTYQLKVQFGLISYDRSAPSNPVQQIATSISFGTTLNNTVSQLNFVNYAAGNVSAVAALKDGQIWAGDLDVAGTHTFSPQTMPASAVSVTSQSMSSGTSGVFCYTTNTQVNCNQWTPNNSQINTTAIMTASAGKGFTSLALLSHYPEALVLFGQDTSGFFAYQIQNGQIVSQNPFKSLNLAGTFSFYASNADSNGNMTLLAVDTDSGQPYVVQLWHDYCGNGYKNSFEACDGAFCNPDCSASSPFSSSIPNNSGNNPIGGVAPSSGISPDGTQNNNAVGPLGDGPQVGVIVPAIVVPVVVVAAGLIILLVLLRRRKNRRGSLLHGKSRVEIAMESIDDRLKIPYKSLVFKKEIGAGSYGKVFIGEWKGTPVAIKVSSSVTDMDGFFDEARITVGLQQHPNVVQTFGVSLDGQLPCIVLELCEGGSLDNRLFDSDVTLSQQQKIALVKGIARGLYHLHTNNIVHRDLAARNVLLNKSGTPKISDFGMSRVLKSEAEKGKTRTNYGPIRWMAPESLRDLQYSTKSDVWSFGIVLYEIVSRNEPHIDVDPLEVAVKIKNESYHPSIPQNVDPVLREIMLSCWQPDPNNRPSMEQICNKLNSSFPDE